MIQVISKYVSLKEATRSTIAARYNIDNTPGEEELQNMIMVATKCFDPLREHFGKPIYISSFYRSPKVNHLAGGSDTSHHMRGMAIDIDGDVYGSPSNAEIFEWLKNNVKFTQLIQEYNFSWVHISYDPSNLKQEVKEIK